MKSNNLFFQAKLVRAELLLPITTDGSSSVVRDRGESVPIPTPPPVPGPYTLAHGHSAVPLCTQH
ncbi:hypothetical protein DPMN_060527 [Dreissena polymorpha]|uniref:Uncharacterized protein n=1 Tax=Dreissena polymorpha TaxID=45954 RepID=A0A9D4C5D8_DREPO|nr:hypothetical protein DPMN_060527 [Dreissena polymorpha]